MSIQTRLKRRSNRGGAKIKHDSTFFSDALRRLRRTKSKKSKNAVNGSENSNRIDEMELCSSDMHANDQIALSGNKDCGSTSAVRSSLFDKFKLPKVTSNSPTNERKCATFDYEFDADEIKVSGDPDPCHSPDSSSYHPTPIISDHNQKPKFNLVKSEKEQSLVDDETLPTLHLNNIKQESEVDAFISELLLNVRKRINSLSFQRIFSSRSHASQWQDDKKLHEKRKTVFQNLKLLGDSFAYDVKNIGSEYLDSFLSVLDDSDEEMEDYNRLSVDELMPIMKNDIEFCSNPVHYFSKQNLSPCSFGDTLFDEGFLSKPLDSPSTCPWPTIDRCLLSSRVESKNGSIYVVRQQKRPRSDERQILSDVKKKKRSNMFNHPPKYITPMEYHNRMMEHREYLERRQWQNIVQSQDFENFYHNKLPTKIPEYIYHNRTRHALSTNTQLLGYMASRVSLFTEETWERIEEMAEETSFPIRHLAPFHIDRFFYQFYFFSAAYLKKSKRRKRSNLLQYFQPELYIMPHHRVPRQQHTRFKFYTRSNAEKSFEVAAKCSEDTSNALESKEHVPTLPDVPSRAAVSSSSKSPELRAVENVYCYKRKS